MNDTALRDRLRGSEEEAVLLAVAEDGGHSSPEVVDAVSGGRADTVRIVSALQDLELVDRNQRAIFDVKLTGKGSRIADQIQESRARGQDRSDAVRLGLLSWLAESGPGVTHVEKFMEDSGAVAYGVPFTGEEVQAASDFLTEKGLIRSKAVWGAGSGFRPEITAEGWAAVESGQTVIDYLRGGPLSQTFNNNANISGGNVSGIQVGGQGNTQQDFTQTVNNDERTQIIAGVADVRRTLDEAGVDSADLQRALDGIHEEAAKPDAIRPALRERVTDAVAIAGATQGASVALQGLAALLGLTG